MDLERKKKNTLVDLCKISASEQDGCALLWSAADETALQSLIQDDTTIDQTSLVKERQKITQACAVTIEDKYHNAESITEIEKEMLKRFTEKAQNDNPSE